MMGAPKPFDGYPSRTAAVAAMRTEGVGTTEIARRIGISEKAVRALEYSALGVAKSTLDKRTVVFPVDLLDSARLHASRRDISVNELCRRVVERVIDDNLVDAVLDDFAEAINGAPALAAGSRNASREGQRK